MNQGITPANCVDQCVMAVGTQSLPDQCADCLYEFEHECGALEVQCAPKCQTSQPTPLFGGGSQ